MGDYLKQKETSLANLQQIIQKSKQVHQPPKKKGKKESLSHTNGTNTTLEQIDHVQGKHSKQSKGANQSPANVCANKTFKMKKKQVCHVQMEQIKAPKKSPSYANQTNYDNKSILKR